MRIVIAEDEALLRTGLTALLAGHGVEVVAQTDRADLVAALVAEHRPDLLVTDIRMPPRRLDDGLRTAIAVRERHPDLGVMVLSNVAERRYAQELFAGGNEGLGYLLKHRVSDVGTFVAGLRRVAAGGSVLDDELVSLMIRRARRSVLEALTPRQFEVLELMAQGRSNAAIAARLQITEKGVTQHTSRIYDELGLPDEQGDHRRVLAVLRYLARS